MATPLASKLHSGPNLLQTLMVDISRRPDVEVAFLQHLQSSSTLALAINHALEPLDQRLFVPISVLRRYLTVAVIRRILLHYGLPASECERVRKNYLIIFTILVCVDEVIWLGHFLKSPRFSDKFLPFKHDYGMPTECHKLSTRFRQVQSHFCAQKLELDELTQTSVDQDVIIPFTNIESINRGVNSSTYKVTIHPDYNHLNRVRGSCFQYWSNKLIESC